MAAFARQDETGSWIAAVQTIALGRIVDVEQDPVEVRRGSAGPLGGTHRVRCAIVWDVAGVPVRPLEREVVAQRRVGPTTTVRSRCNGDDRTIGQAVGVDAVLDQSRDSSRSCSDQRSERVGDDAAVVGRSGPDTIGNLRISRHARRTSIGVGTR